MTRPSRNLDKKMISAGKDIIAMHGIDRLTIRNVCDLAGVNQGMFIYYFKSKENFIFEIFRSIYEECHSLFDRRKVANQPPLEQLRYAIDLLSVFYVEKRRLASEVIIKALKKPALKEKIFSVLENHIVLELINSCRNAGCFDTSLSSFEILILLFWGGIHPSIIYDAGDKNATSERLRIILKGLLKKELQ